MAVEIPIWPGSGSFISGSSTSFGYYDSDTQFQNDAPRVAKWCATRLGYPIVDIELQEANFFDAFEEAVTTYSSIVNDFNIRDNLLNVQGSTTGSNLTQRNVSSTLNKIIEISQEYGSVVGVGGNVEYKTGSIDLIANQQIYDLDALWADVSESSNRITIKKVLHNRTSATNKIYNNYSGNQTILSDFGWENYSSGVSLLEPVWDDILRMQAVEIHEKIRKSHYSFKLINNKLRLFPIPTSTAKLFFEYIVDSEAAGPLKNESGTISDHSNTPYSNIQYQYINSVGKQWIKRYALEITKEMLGEVRSKFSGIPGANGMDITLNGDRLISSAEAGKEMLVTELKETLEELSKRKQLERKDQESEYLQNQMSRVPTKLYVK
jgi:hypothetical protein